MHTRRLAYSSLLALFCLALLLTGCQKKSGADESEASYDQAARFTRQKKYSAAIEAYNKALAQDTLHGFSRRSLDGFREKERLESLVGEYYQALGSCRVLEKHAVQLADSVHTAVVTQKATMLSELGEFSAAAESLARLRHPKPEEQLQLAALWFKAGDGRRAAEIYQTLSLPGGDSAVRIVALSGLLNCSIADPQAGLASPDNYAAKIAAESARVMSMDAPVETRILALRTAAKSLLQLEKQQRNASFLLFRALALAEQAGKTRFAQLLQFESNAVIVQKPDVYRNVIGYFAQNDMQFAQVSALFMLGRNGGISDGDRIKALSEGLSICQVYGIPAAAEDGVFQERAAMNQLADLLIAHGMYFELLERSEQAKLLELRRDLQANIVNFRLPPGNEKLQQEIIELTREINGLLQRKINMVESCSGFEFGRTTDEAINLKRSRLFELLAEVEKVDSRAAAMLQMNPVTLTTIQKSLKPDQALVQLFIRDSLCTALLISNREMQIVSNPVPSSQLNAGLANLRNTLERAGVASAQTMVKNRDRVWLNNVLLHSMSEKLSRYEHLIFISDTPIPLHLMGDDRFLGREKKLSMLYSAREAVLSAPSPPGKDKVPTIVFFNASAIADARIYKMLHGEDKVFLLWKNMTKDQLDELKILMELYFKREKSGSGFLNSLASGTGDLTGDQWLYLSSYGFD